MSVSTKQSWGVAILVVVALLYLVPYFIAIERPRNQVTEVYFADRITEAHRILIERYNRLHEGRVKVVPIDFPNPDFSTNDRKEIFARSLRGEGDGIDLLAVDVIWVQRFAKWAEPLGKYFSEAEIHRISSDAMHTCYRSGELVAVPLDLVQGVMFYREDLLKRMPGGDRVIQAINNQVTWPEFLKLKQQLHCSTPFYIFPSADYEGLICCYVEILLSLKPDYFSTIGFDFTSREAKEALQLLVDLVHKYGASPAAVTSFTEVPSYEYFIRNNGLFIRGWTTYPQDFKDAPYDWGKKQHLKRAPIPYLPDGSPASVFGGWNLMVSRFSTKKEAAVDFAKFLLSDSSQEVFYTKGGYYPVTTAFYQDSTYLQKYPEISNIKRLMKTGMHRPVQEEYTRYSKIMSHYFSLAIKGRLTVDEALAKTTEGIQSEKTLVTVR